MRKQFPFQSRGMLMFGEKCWWKVNQDVIIVVEVYFLSLATGLQKKIVSKDMVSLTEKCMVLENFAKVRQISERR